MSKLLPEKHGAVTLLTLNRPEVHNHVDEELACLLADAIIGFGADEAQHVLVIAGADGTTFCAGANLKGMRALFEHRHTHSAGPMDFCRLEPGKPTIAAINGNCWAGGVELALWCDFRIVDEHSRFGLLNKRRGLPLADGGTQRLPREVGIANALYLIESGMKIDAHQAQLMGLAQEVVPAGTALERALAVAAHIAAYPQGGIRAARQAALATLGLSLDDGLQLEVELCHTPSPAPEALAGRQGARHLVPVSRSTAHHDFRNPGLRHRRGDRHRHAQPPGRPEHHRAAHDRRT